MTYIASIKNSFNSVYAFVDRQLLRQLSPLQKKVALVVATLFSCVIAGYCLYRCCLSKKVTRADRDQALKLKQEGETLRLAGKYTEAADKIKESLELDDDPKALKVYAETLLMKKDFTEAKAVFEEILVMAPQDPFALSGLGEVLRMQGQYQEAIDLYKTAETHEPKNMRALAGHAHAARLLGRYEEASEYFQKVLAEDDKNIDALSGYADTLSWQNQTDKAVEQFKTLLPLDPTNLFILNSYGETLIQVPDLDGALQQFEEALKIAPQNLLALRGQAEVLFRLDRKDEAKAKVAELLKIEPQNASDYVNQALALMITDQSNEAIEKLKTALTLRPQYFFAHVTCARILHKMPGKQEDTIKHLQQAIGLSPHHVVVLNAYGDLLIEIEQLVQAKKQFEKVLEIDKDNAHALKQKEHCETFLEAMKKV